jgi:hypothetical protein
VQVKAQEPQDMTLSLYRKYEGPPGGWHYRDKDTGIDIPAVNYSDLLKAVREHRKANALPIPLSMDEQIDQQLCEQLGPDWCKNKDYVGEPRGLSFDQAFNGTRTLIDWALHGQQRVSQEEATRRAEICRFCTFNQQPEDCRTCALEKLSNLVTGFIGVGGVETPHDAYLHVCSICGCNLRVKVTVPIESIQKFLTADQLTQLPDHCWVKPK